MGKVKGLSRQAKAILLTIEANKVLEDVKIGDSVAVNGVCLTVVRKEKNALSFEMMPETAKITDLGVLRISDRVNLERSLKLGDRLSGHFVLGHVDCLGTIRSKGFRRDNLVFQIACDRKFEKYIIPKGSVSLDGISLTVGDKKAGIFSVYIISHTLKNTTLGFKGPSDKVNIEFDLLAKSVNSWDRA